MAIRIRTATPDDFIRMFRMDSAAFGFPITDEDVARQKPLLPFERFRLAIDGDDLVGQAGSFSFELTLPGRGRIPIGGTTWVTVATTHRRRGLLGRLLAAIHDDMSQRGDAAAALIASEGGIYERFGYGVATRFRAVTIDRRAVRFRDEFVPERGTVRLVDPADHVDDFQRLFDRYRRQRVGEISRSPAWTAMRVADAGSEARAALHRDGFAIWKLTADWGDGEPNHEIRVLDFAAATPEAHRALWHVLLSTDLVGPVRNRLAVSLDDPLPHFLTDPRAVRTDALVDLLWVRPSDIGAAFGARRYRTADDIVVAVADGGGDERWRIEGGPDGARASRVRRRPDLTATRAALGALLLGGVSAASLAAGGRIEARRRADLTRADLFFGWEPMAHCSTSF